MKQLTAFSPGHVTGFFEICDEPTDPLLKGSRGAGVSIDRGVTTDVAIRRAPKGCDSKVKIEINGRGSEAEVSKRVINAFLSYVKRVKGSANFNVFVEHDVRIPIGAGFGSSGAGALSLALALNEALEAGLSKHEAAQIAHVAEVECKTGLGTVIAETFGGLEARVKPGAPGIGEIVRVPIDESYAVVSLSFGPLSTKRALSDLEIRRRVNEAGGKLLNEFLNDLSVDNFLRLSRGFAERIGLITDRVRKILIEADEAGLTCSMPMFGEAVFTIVERDSIERALKTFGKYASTAELFVCGIDFEGARLIDGIR